MFHKKTHDAGPWVLFVRVPDSALAGEGDGAKGGLGVDGFIADGADSFEIIRQDGFKIFLADFQRDCFRIQVYSHHHVDFLAFGDGGLNAFVVFLTSNIHVV